MNPFVLLTVSVISLLVAILLGSGAVKFYVNYHTRLVLCEEKASKIEQQGKDLVATQTEVKLMKQMLDEINGHLKKLDIIPEMKATVDAMSRRLDELDELRRQVHSLATHA